jgi:hypothetical protein
MSLYIEYLKVIIIISKYQYIQFHQVPDQIQNIVHQILHQLGKRRNINFNLFSTIENCI